MNASKKQTKRAEAEPFRLLLFQLLGRASCRFGDALRSSYASHTMQSCLPLFSSSFSRERLLMCKLAQTKRNLPTGL